MAKKGRIKRITLVCKATRDGDNPGAFQNSCFNIGPTLSLMENAKGKRFGGFTKADWGNAKEESYHYDNEAFLFSLNKKKTYNIQKPEYATKNHPQYWQIFGTTGVGDGIGCYVGFLCNNNCFEDREKKNTCYQTHGRHELTGEAKGKLIENEVFRIEFCN